MKVVCVLALLLGVACAGVITTANVGAALQFHDWMTVQGKVYGSDAAYDHAFSNFQQTLARIEAKNAEGHATFGLTKFADLSPSEFSGMYLNYKPASDRGTPINIADSSKFVGDAPEIFDWRSKNAVSPVKDQGQCGSCWAFSTTEEIESMWFLDGNDMPELAPQQIVSCDKVDQGCNGGDTTTAYAYVIKAGGLEAGSDYPYVSGNSGENGQCKFNKADVVAHISAWSYAIEPCDSGCGHQNETGLQAALLAVGPLSICVDAESWQDYSGGVLGNCPHAYTDLDHCVQLVGYNTPEKYWIVRNSWNTDWGVEGYIYIGTGKNECGLCDEVTYATV